MFLYISEVNQHFVELMNFRADAPEIRSQATEAVVLFLELISRFLV